MVRNLFRWLHQEIGGLHQAAFLLALSTFGAQLLALVRDRLLAAHFGASRTLDIYYNAFRVPDLVFVSVGSLVSVTIIIPFLFNRLQEGKTDEAKRLFDSLFTFFCLLMISVAVVLGLLAPLLARLSAPGFSPADQLAVAHLMRWLFLSPLLLGLSNLAGSITQAYKKFFVYALSPILYNLGIIFGIVFFYPVFGLTGLAWGVVLGALLHLSIQLPSLWSLGFWPRLTGQLQGRELWQIIGISIPRTLTLASQQIALFALVALATWLTPGSVSVFNLAYNLQGVPYALIGVSYAVATFPVMVQIFKRGDREEFRNHFFVAARQVIFWSFLVTAFAVVLRAHLVRVVLGSGSFDWSATRLTAAVLALFVLSTTAQSLILLFVRAYYAAGQTRRPLLINFIATVVIIILAFVLLWVFNTFPPIALQFVKLLRVDGLVGASVLMLPLAFTLGLWFNLWLHWQTFKTDFGATPPAVGRMIWQVILGAVAGAGTTYLALNVLAAEFGLDTFWRVLSQGLSGGLLGLLVSAIIFRTLGNKEWEEVTTALQRRFWRVETLQPGPEKL